MIKGLLLGSGLCALALAVVQIALSRGWLPHVDADNDPTRAGVRDAIATGCFGPFIAIGITFALAMAALGLLGAAGVLWIGSMLVR